MHRCAIAECHHQRSVRGRVFQLPVRFDHEGTLGAVQGAGRQIDVATLDRTHYFVDAEVAGREASRIKLHAHRVLLRSEHLHLRDARQRRNALGEEILRVLVDLRHRQGLRSQREHDDRRVGRVDLAKRRRVRHVGRQLPRGGGDRRLHVLCSGVDVAIERELQRDLRRTLAAGGAHRIDGGDG